MNGWKRGLGVGLLLSFPTLVAVLLAFWFDSASSTNPQPHASAPSRSERRTEPIRASAKLQPLTAAASSATTAGYVTQTRGSIDAYSEAVEERRRSRLDTAFDEGKPAPIWTEEVSAYVRDALSRLQNGGTLRSVECRSTLCKVLVDLPKLNGSAVEEFPPMPEHEQRTFAVVSGAGGATITYYLAPEGKRMKSITETQYK